MLTTLMHQKMTMEIFKFYHLHNLPKQKREGEKIQEWTKMKFMKTLMTTRRL